MLKTLRDVIKNDIIAGIKADKVRFFLNAAIIIGATTVTALIVLIAGGNPWLFVVLPVVIVGCTLDLVTVSRFYRRARRTRF